MHCDKRLKVSPLAIGIVGIYAVVSLCFDRVNFEFRTENSYLLYAVLKIIQLAFIAKGVDKVTRLWKAKRVDKKTNIFVTLFCLFAVGQILLWPGNWVETDEYSVYQAALVLQVHLNQGLFATSIHILGLMFFFHRGAVVLFQCLLAACICSEIIEQHEAITGKNAVVFCLLLFTPVSLYYLYQPMRTFLFAILILLFLLKYIVAWNCNDCETNLRKRIWYLTVLVSGIMCIRTEFKFMILGYPILLICLLKHHRVKISKLILPVAVIMTLVLLAYSKLETSDAGGGSRLAMNFIMPDYYILTDPKFNWETNKKEVDAIDRVVPINEILTKTNCAYTAAEMRDGYTHKEMNAFLKANLNLILRYPRDFISCRWNVFLRSVGFNAEEGSIQTTGYTERTHIVDSDLITQKPHPLNKRIRNLTSDFLGGQFELFGIWMYFVFWALWIPIVITCELFIISLWERRFDFSLVLTVLLGELFCTILMAPVKYSMYYFANYLGGWYMLYLYCAYKNKNTTSKIKKGNTK